MIAALRFIVYWTLRPLWRLLLRVYPADDPWERIDYRVPVGRFGAGSMHDFGWYLDGESLVRVENIEQVTEWLLGCEYLRDTDLFHESDFWQHPRTFERLRRGDCEDHALWAWRKLLELGYDAELVSGRCLPSTPSGGDAAQKHVWVIFRRDGETFLLESVAKRGDRMVRLLRDAMSEYRPEYGVDRHRERFVFNGALHTMRDREFGVP